MNVPDQWNSEFIPKAKRTFNCGYCNGIIAAGTSCFQEMGFVQGNSCSITYAIAVSHWQGITLVTQQGC